MILSAILYWVLTAAILMLIQAITPGIHISGFATALLAAFVMGLVNFFIRPVLMLLTLPLNLLTLGLFSFVINALLFALVAWLIPGFEITNFLSALVGSIFMAIMTSTLALILGDRGRFA